MADFGYDVADYTDVDPLFGTIEDFDRLLHTAHLLGLKVIIDWVPNHTSDQHPWFVESRSSRTNSKRDWYVWQDPKPDGSLPNNWQSNFGGPAWDFDAASEQYYLHSFLPEQPDLNWRNPDVVEAMFDTLRFWLDRGVDGFRIDVAHYLMKDPNLTDNPPAAPTEAGGDFKALGEYDAWDHINDKGHPDIHGVFRQLRQVTDSYRGDRFVIGEIHIFDWDEWALYYGDGDELHMPFNFSLVWAPWEAAAIRTRIEALESAVPPEGWPNYVLGNHDEQRLATRYGPENARAAATLLLTLRGQPTLYYGDELAMRETDVPTGQEQDPWGIRVPGLSRDGCRTPMPWTTDPGHGFTDPSAAPWLPFGADAAERNVEAQLADPDSTLNYVRRLVQLRKARPSLYRGSVELLDELPDDVLGYERRDGNESTIVLVNFAGEPRLVTLEAPVVVLVSTEPVPGGTNAGTVSLAPHEAMVMERSTTE
jgi:alpha-glucosidase